MFKRIIINTAVAICFGTILSADTLTIPEGCEAIATVHRDSCVVSNYLKCGDRNEIHAFENGVLSDSHVFGPDWDLTSYVADGGRFQMIADAGSTPEVSLSEALETGQSTGERQMLLSTGVLKAKKVTLSVDLRLSDETVDLSGQTLRKGTLTRLMTLQSNGVTTEYQFEVFATPDGSLFIEGAADRDQFGKKDRLEWTPRKIVMPSEDGFATTTALVGCGG